MSDVLKLLPEPQARAWIKNPYDEAFHEVLKASAEKCLKYMPSSSTAFVTDFCVIIASHDIQHKIISYFTAYANLYWNNKKQMLVFEPSWWQLNEFDTDFLQKSCAIDARAEYEMYIEEHKFDVQGGLFPEYAFLPFEKTPEYYRKGIIITS
jgi:hypothetical protein